MQRRKLGSLDISEVGLGTWPLGGPVKYMGFSVGWRAISDDDALKILHAVSDRGINFIDTADIYGPNGRAESLIGKALGTNKDMLVATKVGFITDRDLPPGRNQDFSQAHLRKACEASLKRLRRDTIDLYQLHCVPLTVMRQGEVFEVLDALKKEGKIREYGVSIVTTDEALAALEFPGVRSLQIIFNMFRQKPIWAVFPKAKEKGVGILARVPLASGLLTGKFKAGHQFEDGDHRKQGIPGETFGGVDFKKGLQAVEELKSLVKPGERSLAQAALAYTLSFDAVSCTIPGAVTLEQLQENSAPQSLTKLSPADLELCQRVYQTHFKTQMEKRF